MKYCKFFLALFLVTTMIISALPALADTDSDSEKTVICIDPGHGGRDGGTDVGTKTEKEYNLAISLALRDALLEDGRFEVVMTRGDDTYLKYLARADIARQANADLLVSVHCNQVEESYVDGTQAYVSLVEKYNAASLAGAILDAIESASGIRRGKVLTRADSGDSLGVYYWNADRQWDMPGAAEYAQVSDYFSMNTWSSKFGIPSIIIEHGYLSNEHDLAILNSEESIEKIARAEAGAIIEYFTNHEHSYVPSVDYPSNCVFAGSASERCTVCGRKIGSTALDPDSDAHFWRIESSVAATCTEEGSMHLVCQISYNLNAKGGDCAVHEKDEVIPASGHLYRTTDETRGIRECERCGDVIYSLCTGGAEHRYSLTESVAATCTEDGRNTYRCTVCGDEYSDIFPASGHDYAVADEIEPAGDADGRLTLVCSVCGDQKTEILPACEHQWATEVISETCTEEGSITRMCILCGHTDKTVYPALGHWLETDECEYCAPTCTEDGYLRGICKRCGEDVTEPIPATGHAFYKAGRYELCPRCGEKRERPLGEFLTDNPVFIAAAVIFFAVIAAIVIIISQTVRAKKRKIARRKVLEDEWSKQK